MGADATGRRATRATGHVDTVGPLMMLDGVTVSGGVFSRSRLRSFCSIGSRFTGCKFEDMRVDGFTEGAGKTASVYRECSFDKTRIKRMGGGRARFEGCSFRDVSISWWMTAAVEMVDCVFTGKIAHSVFWGVPSLLDRKFFGERLNEFAGNDFSGCRMVDAGFRGGVDLRRQELPQGEGYLYVEDGAGAIEVAAGIVGGWEDEAMRRQGEIMLKILREELSQGQEQLFLARETGRNESIWPQLCDALRGVR